MTTNTLVFIAFLLASSASRKMRRETKGESQLFPNRQSDRVLPLTQFRVQEAFCRKLLVSPSHSAPHQRQNPLYGRTSHKIRVMNDLPDHSNPLVTNSKHLFQGLERAVFPPMAEPSVKHVEGHCFARNLCF